MAASSRAMVWRRLDTAGAEHAILTEGHGLRAHGTIIAAEPVPYACRYEVFTDESWAALRVEVSVEGPGFVRSARLERAAGRWRVTATEQGDLDRALRSSGHPAAGLPGSEEPSRLARALDVDLGNSPLFRSLPIRRLGLLDAAPGPTREIEVAWVLVPSLTVVAARQTYTALGGDSVRFAGEGAPTDLTVNSSGDVVHVPGVATLG